MRVEPHDGINVLIRREKRQSFLSAMWRYSKKTAFGKPGGEHSPKPNLVGNLISDFPASRNVINVCC